MNRQTLLIGGALLGAVLLLNSMSRTPQQTSAGGSGGVMVIPGSSEGYLAGEAMKSHPQHIQNINVDASLPSNIWGDDTTTLSTSRSTSDSETQATGSGSSSPSRSTTGSWSSSPSRSTTATGGSIPLTASGQEAQDRIREAQPTESTQFISPAQATAQSMLSGSPLSAVTINRETEERGTPSRETMLRAINTIRDRISNPLARFN